MGFKKAITSTYLWEVVSPPWKWVKRKKTAYMRKASVARMLRTNGKDHKKIFYCGVCESSNMGDMAQTYCFRKWFSENYPDYKVIECKTSFIMDDGCGMIEGMKKITNSGDLFFIQSGYNTHDLGGQEDFMHQRVITAFPENEIIILPQTVFFKDQKRKQLCSDVYNGHKKVLFYARDPISMKISEEMFPDLTIKILPDIATTLIGKNDYRFNRSGVHLCHRNDLEQYYKEDDYAEFAGVLSKYGKVDISDTIIKDSCRKIYADLEGYVEDMVKKFARYKLIVTDKYHGLIFSLAANTPVIVLRSTDHKVVSGYEWFSKIYADRIYFAETAEDIERLSKRILDNPRYNQLDDYFKREYYDKLKADIDRWRAKNTM